MSITRRQFLAASGAAGTLAATGALTNAARASWAPDLATDARRLPAPARSGLDHVVVLCMENRSFDHFLGWVPGANGRQAGLLYPDDSGTLHATHHLTDWSGCGFNDPDHSYDGGRVELAGGRLDGFRRGGNDDFALGYYDAEDVPTYAALGRHFTICDQWFCGILGPTYPNRFYTHASTTDRIDNTQDTSVLPTVWDRLSAAGVPARYYFSDLPFLALWGSKYIPIARPIDAFFADAAAGTLASYSYLDPFFVGEDQGASNDDHPHADIRRGQAFVSSVVNALMQGPLWDRTLLIVTYDEWGGFFDHVPPPRLPDGPPLHIGGRSYDRTQAGFRVPTFIVSSRARPGRIAHDVFNHASVLALIEWRWGLRPLTPRDASAANPATVLDFAYRNPAVSIPAQVDPGPHACRNSFAAGAGLVTGMANADRFWEELAASPLVAGWDLPNALTR